MGHVIHKDRETEGFQGIAYFIWEKIKDDIYPAFAPMGMDRKGLQQEGLACSSFLDLQVCYYIWMEARGAGSAGAAWISSKALEAWGIGLDGLEAKAMGNLMGDGYRIVSVAEVLEGMAGGRRIPPSPIPLYVLTNRRKAYGAAGILDRSLIQGLAREADSGIFILPSSRHEVLLIPESEGTDAEGLSQMVRDVNQDAVAPEDRLSDHVYYYDKQTDEIRIAG